MKNTDEGSPSPKAAVRPLTATLEHAESLCVPERRTVVPGTRSDQFAIALIAQQVSTITLGRSRVAIAPKLGISV
jgi:hypothetical protein